MSAFLPKYVSRQEGYVLEKQAGRWWQLNLLLFVLSLILLWRLPAMMKALALLLMGVSGFLLTEQFSKFRLSIMAEGLLIELGSYKELLSWQQLMQLHVQLADGRQLSFGDASLSPKDLNTCVLVRIPLPPVMARAERKHLILPADRKSGQHVRQFVQLLYNHFVERSPLLLERIDHMLRRIEQYRQQDIGLMQELEEALFDTYKTLYEPSPPAEAISSEAPIWVYSRGKHRVTFYESHRRNDLQAETRQLAEQLIRLSQDNMEVLQSRISYYDSILESIRAKRALLQDQHTLKQVAMRLQRIQARSMGRQEHIQRLDVGSLSLEQLSLLDELTNRVQQIETLEASLVLTQYMDAFKQDAIAHNEVLRELNEKLSRLTE